MPSPSFLFRSTFLFESSKYLFRTSPIRSHHLICPRQMSSASQSPWLMLPPAIEWITLSRNQIKPTLAGFKFYSLAENREITLTGSGEKEITDVMHNQTHHSAFKGSSHGWLALFNQPDLFLYNPISRRRIKLPPIHNLPNFPPHSSNTCSQVTKVILSCSPDTENCRAVMIYGWADFLAFCCPGRSKAWTPIGVRHRWDEGKGMWFPRSYEDCVYSSEQESFFGLTKDGDLETWDLRDPSFPKMIMSSNLDDDNLSESEDEEEWWMPEKDYDQQHLPKEEYQHLVVADDHDLLVVNRYILQYVGPDDSYADMYDKEDMKNIPRWTVDYEIYKYDSEKGDTTYVDSSSLGGLALFIGSPGQTVAVPATHFPRLEPNSIYSTDTVGIGCFPGRFDAPDGGHDIAIFNYEDRTVRSCFYPFDEDSFVGLLPMWFFPSSPIF